MKDGRFPLSVLFYAQGLPFHGGPIENQSLGGSESALWFVANELAKRGHMVDVVCVCPKPGLYQGVTYHDLSSFPQLQVGKEWDLVIASRYFPILATPLRSKMSWLWLHDMPSGTDSAKQMASCLFQTEQVMVLSEFHRQAYLKAVPELDPVLWKTTNGVDLELLKKHGVGPRNAKRLIYASRPERGLEYLLRVIWPQLLERDPELELALCGYDVKTYPFNDDMREFYAYCDQLIAKSPRVTNYDCLGKADYYALLSTSALMAYPTQFCEISCISALETMSVGTPIVTTHDFALAETVPYEGIAGLPSNPDYAERFVNRTIELLQKPLIYRQLQKRGRQWVEEKYQWSQVAESWEDRAFALFEKRFSAQGVQICRGLLWDSDVIAAEVLGADIEMGLADEGKDTSAVTALVLEAREALRTHHQDPNEYFDHSVPEAEWAQLNPRFSKVIEMLPEQKPHGPVWVLDIGCGSGALLGHIAKTRPDVACVGADFSPKLIAFAQKKAQQENLSDRIRFVSLDVADHSDAPDPLDEAYDVGIAAEILEHIPDYWTLIDRLESRVRNGGTIILTIPSGPWESYSFDVPIEDHRRYHVHHFELRDLQDVFGQKLNLTIEYRFAQFGARGDQLGWWFVRYRNAPTRPTGRVNYQRKILTAKPRQTIAACLIVKNEEQNIVRCIDSIKGVVDEIHVWDCGSTDRTMGIVEEKYSHRYHPVVHAWRLNPDPDSDGIPNFGYWRNRSISETKADWVWWMDADEILQNGQNLRKYATHCSLFEAYVVKQNHLTFKQEPLPPDLPQRLFRNGKGYQFFGCLHEQPGVTLNDEIQPSLCIPDVDVIHYGYVTAESTRWKCFERNLPALIKDRHMHPTRHLGPLLVLRDCLNRAQLLLERTGMSATEEIVQLVRGAAVLYLQNYADPKGKYHHYAFRYYQLALRALGLRGLPVVDGGTPPFEVKLQMAVGVGGLDDRPLPEPPSRWFVGPQEFQRFLSEQSDVALGPMIAQAEAYARQNDTVD